MSNKKESFRRMDFKIEVISSDEENFTITFRIFPDPQRYEWKVIEGKRFLYDKLDDVLFSEEAVIGLLEQIKNQKIYFQPQKINDAVEYVRSRIPIIQSQLKGNEICSTFEDKSEEFLESLSQDELGFVIVCVDIVKSTKLATSLEPEKYNRLISTALYEISEIIPKFHGHVLKYTGDGLIAYFPEPSFITKNDLAIDCALTVWKLVYRVLNQILEENGYPHIDIRIGLDSGDAFITAIGSPATKRHKDIIGGVVNLATKIQHLGDPGDILLGEITERNLHTMWRQICEKIKLGEDWSYKDSEGQPYAVYRIKRKHLTSSDDDK